MLNYGVERYAKFVKQFADLSVELMVLKQYDKEESGSISCRSTYV